MMRRRGLQPAAFRRRAAGLRCCTDVGEPRTMRRRSRRHNDAV